VVATPSIEGLSFAATAERGHHDTGGILGPHCDIGINTLPVQEAADVTTKRVEVVANCDSTTVVATLCEVSGCSCRETRRIAIERDPEWLPPVKCITFNGR
jgi:hypothetical protein